MTGATPPYLAIYNDEKLWKAFEDDKEKEEVTGCPNQQEYDTCENWKLTFKFSLVVTSSVTSLATTTEFEKSVERKNVIIPGEPDPDDVVD